MSSGSRYATRAARERREKLEGGILKGGTEKRLGEDACKLRVRPVCRGAYNSRECGKGYYWTIKRNKKDFILYWNFRYGAVLCIASYRIFIF